MHNFISTCRRPWPGSFWWFTLSISMPTMDRVDFPSPSFYPWTTCVFPSLVSESFLKKYWRAQFYLKVAKVTDPIPFGDLPSPFQRPQWIEVDFSATSFYPWTTCVFPALVCESFLKKCWRAQFYLKMAKAPTRVFWWFLLSISMPTMDLGRFSSHLLLSLHNMCFSFFILREFSEEMLTCTILA